MMGRLFVILFLWGCGLPLQAAPAGKAGFDSVVSVFFKANCVKCPGPENAKGKVTLHDLDGDLAGGKMLQRWELILDVLMAGEMPPEEEKSRPAKTEVLVVTQWIEKDKSYGPLRRIPCRSTDRNTMI